MSLVDPVVSPYDRLVWPEGAIEQLLATGQRRREVMAYLGEREYQHLQPMAVLAASTPGHRNHCVFIVPGIMGSQLGLPRAPLPDNLLWVDPTDFQQGNLGLLALPGPEIRSCGPVLYNYLALKFALQIAGFTVRFFDYDWRRDLQELGAQLALRIEAQFATQPTAISLVGHSMGGLVGRTALLTAAGARVHRLVTLGAPHEGSFAPVQALRGVYPLVRRIAQLDPVRSAETLARDVFATFHSLYQMLPRPHTGLGLDLLDPRNWPRTGPQPNATLLARVPMLQLGGADKRIVAVAGCGFQTVVNATLVHDDFFYRVEPGGDGTVPTARAVMAGVPVWYCRVAHSELPRDSAVQTAVVRLLAGETPSLSTTPLQEPATGFAVSDRELREQFVAKIDWSLLSPDARRHFLDSLNEPTPLRPTGTAYTQHKPPRAPS